MAIKAIQIRPEVCTGCRACETACVFDRDGLFGTSRARIHVHKDEAKGIDRPRLCRLCPEPECITACPVQALERDLDGTIKSLSEKCLSCGACRLACPYGAVFSDPQTGKPLICDLCGGNPSCIPRCPTGALVIED